MGGLKRCTVCKRQLSTDHFYRNRRTKDGLFWDCKQCRDKYTIAYSQTEKAKRAASLRRKAKYVPHPRHRQSLEETKRKAREYYKNNREAILEHQRAYVRRNREKEAARVRHWEIANRDRRVAIVQRHNARKRGLPDTLTAQDWQHCLSYWHRMCAVCCSLDKLHADHWIPLTDPNCPGTVPHNMIPLCGRCNCSKNDKPPLVWLNERYEPEDAAYIAENIEWYLDNATS